MKTAINCCALVACFTLSASLAHAGQMGHDEHMSDGKMRGHMEGEYFKNMDSDSDGMISKAEFDAAHAKHFQEMDTNSDGKLSIDEMKAGHGKNREGRKDKRFDKTDANHDGALSREEMEKMPRMSKNFDKMDGNKDGKVTREEMEAAMNTMRRKNRSD